MENTLCHTCRLIDPEFFSQDSDNTGFMQGPAVQHLPVNWIERSARAGCSLCTCLIADSQTDWLPRQLLETRRVVLRRAMIDPKQAIDMHVDGNDVSHTYFFRVPATWKHLPVAQLGKPCPDLKLMSSWIAECVQHHSDCSHDGTHFFLPTRLLDLRAFGASRDLRLVSFDKDDTDVRYVALSHCWGPPSKRPLTTETSNLHQRSQRISFSDLSLTFKDAVKLTRDLGQRYLWIDSLCIVQDDPADWVREASQMAMVYGNALLTLFALSSLDSTYGCRVAKPQAITHSNRFFDFDSGPYRIRLFEKSIHKWHEEYGDNTYRHGEYGHNPLRQRAWTLQERELSTRGIHFSQNLVLWQCKTLKASSELPWHEVRPVDDFQPWPVKKFVAEDLAPGGPVLTRDRWYELMEDYMSRNLTKEADKLPALSGLAQSFQSQLSSSRYLAGLWTCHLPHALLWQIGTRNTWSDARRSVSYRAPSWSFLSLEGNMSYESQRLFSDGEDRPQENTADFEPSDLTIVDINVQPSGTDQYGAIDKASLLLHGKMIQLKIKRAPTGNDENITASSETWKGLELHNSVAGAFSPDIIGELPDDTEVWCLSVLTEPFCAQIPAPYNLDTRQFPICEDIGSNEPMVMGLALLQDGDDTTTFKRVGLVRWVKKSLFSGITPSNLTLI